MSILVATALLFFLLRLWLSGFGGIHPDEAYYWVWAQDLKLGYFDHPPMVAWVIALSEKVASFFIPESLLSTDAFKQMSFRWLPYFLSCFCTPLILGATARRLQHTPITLSQALLMFLTPLFVFASHIITPDAPFFFAVALCLYLTVRIRALRGANPIPGDVTPFSWQLSIMMGLALAFAAYSKFTAILLIFLFIITGSGLFNALVAGAVSLLLVLPYFVWTITTGKEIDAGLYFQFQNALAPHNAPVQWKRVGDLWGAQLILWGPISFLFFINFFIKSPMKRGYLFVWGLLPLLFFSIGGLRRPAEANWPLIGALPAFVLLMVYLNRRTFTTFFIVSSNVLVMLLGSVILLNSRSLAPYVESFSPRLAQKMDKPSRLQELQGWKRFREFLFEATTDNTAPILVDRYQLLSPLLFYDSMASSEEQLGSRLKIWQEGGSRRSHFDTSEEFLFDGQGPYWVLAEDIRKRPDNCRVHQSIFRDEAPHKDYFVFKCSPAEKS